ncbi:ATP-binding cassette domain-containing protein [Butyrivibrio sp. JL13D10]|uniref:ABC transporter ATP-binding protein n=1 Tax=Butyrivibrio sp. JL13D10 TaxID=3236815 RepID=UPI0038B47FCE
MEALSIKNLTKRYGDFTAVDGISFKAEAGALLGFLGINGAGKSTTINMLSTLLSPTGGEAYVCGYKLGKEDMEIRKSIGIVYQSNVLDDLLTVKENLMIRAQAGGLDKAKIKARLDDLTTLLKLEPILHKRYRLLSGGQKRRCEIALALMHSPKLLFLDEPTTGLDPATRIDVWETIRTLRASEDMTVFLTTHYMEEAASADKIIIIDHGKKLAEGTPFELKEKYAKDKLKLYFDEGNENAIAEILKKEDVKSTGYGAKLSLSDSLKAYDILSMVREKINGFEVIQGNMDDVFLNVTGMGKEEI